jgi:hypothetical protein
MWRIVLIAVAGCLGAAGQDGITPYNVPPTTLRFPSIDPDTGGPAAQSSALIFKFADAAALTLSLRDEVVIP